MKINREARSMAKRLFRLCRPGGRLDEKLARQVVKKVAEERPRNYLAILTRFRKLVEFEKHARTAVVESATPLGAEEARLRTKLLAQFGADLQIQAVANPSLIGGLRIRVGSDIWDGSVRGRLDALQQRFKV